MSWLKNFLVISTLLVLYFFINPGIQTKFSYPGDLPSEQLKADLFTNVHAVELQQGFKFQSVRPVIAQGLSAFKADLINTEKLVFPVLLSENNFSDDLIRFPEYFRTFYIIFPFHDFW